MRALLVDDDAELAALLTDYLAPHGVTLTHAATGDRGLECLAEGGIDVVLLDVMLPFAKAAGTVAFADRAGFLVFETIRASSSVPVLMLTARGDDADRIAGLELGADDYLPKPFNPRELLARMRAVVRRATPSALPPPLLRVGDLSVDPASFRVELAGAEVPVTSFEFRLLEVLVRHAGEPVSREALAAAVGGEAYDPAVDRSLDVHVSHLRQKLELNPREPRRIKTVRGIGYLFART